ncbi:MAG: DUF2798 domain-containing protein [Arcobacteraceae bacterium]
MGFIENFIAMWLEAFAKAFVCAFPLVFIFAPIAHKISLKCIKKD